MHSEVLKEMHKLNHEDEQRFQLLMRYLRLIEQERKQRGFLRKLKKQWETHKKITEKTWN
jgi:hypothetical protein